MPKRKKFGKPHMKTFFWFSILSLLWDEIYVALTTLITSLPKNVTCIEISLENRVLAYFKHHTDVLF